MESSRVKSSRHSQLLACAAFGQRHSGELDSPREPGHRGQGLHYWLWHRQPTCPDYKSGLQTALLQHWEPRWVFKPRAYLLPTTSHYITVELAVSHLLVSGWPRFDSRSLQVDCTSLWIKSNFQYSVVFWFPSNLRWTQIFGKCLEM